MDLLKNLLEEESILSYLKNYPTAKWPSVIKKALLYAVHSMKILNTLSMPLGKPTTKLRPKRINKRSSSNLRPKQQSKPRIRPKVEDSKERRPTVRRHNESGGSHKKKPHESLFVWRSLDPDSQENAETSVVSVTPKHAIRKLLLSDSPTQEVPQPEASTLSANPSEEMKKFYQNEFKYLFPEECSKRPRIEIAKRRVPSQPELLSSSSEQGGLSNLDYCL